MGIAGIKTRRFLSEGTCEFFRLLRLYTGQAGLWPGAVAEAVEAGKQWEQAEKGRKRPRRSLELGGR